MSGTEHASSEAALSRPVAAEASDALPAASAPATHKATKIQMQGSPPERMCDPELLVAHVRRCSSDPDLDGSAWKIDGSGKGGHYHSMPSLCVVMLAQINYIVSLVVVIPTAAGYAASLGDSSTVFFGLVVGISSIINPLVSRVWNTVIRATNLNTVLLISSSICLVCSLMYVAANYFGGTALLLVSRVLLGMGSVQTANLKYLGCAVSTKRVKFTHFLTTAAIAYGFAFGTLIAFPLSLLAARRDWNQNTMPGWFAAFLWLGYIVLHKLVFVEPDLHAGVVDPESKIRLEKDMRPKKWREPLTSLAPCLAAIFGVAVIKGAFEVMTIEFTRELWQWDVMTSAMYLGVTMFLVALTTMLSCRLERRLGEGRTFILGLSSATLLLPLYYIPISPWHHERMASLLGMSIYFVVSILALSSLNLGRTIAFSLITELPSPHWRNFFLSFGSEVFTMGRGVGPILAGCIADRQIIMSVLIGVCALASGWVGVSFAMGMLEHEEHELGPARAELGEVPVESWEPTMDEIRKDIDEWWSGLGFNGSAGATTPSRGVKTPSRKAVTPSGGALRGEKPGRAAGVPLASAAASAASALRKVAGEVDRHGAPVTARPAPPAGTLGSAGCAPSVSTGATGQSAGESKEVAIEHVALEEGLVATDHLTLEDGLSDGI